MKTILGYFGQACCVRELCTDLAYTHMFIASEQNLTAIRILSHIGTYTCLPDITLIIINCLYATITISVSKLGSLIRKTFYGWKRRGAGSELCQSLKK